MGAQKHHKSTIERIQKVRALTERYYEAGNQRRCYKAVWKKYVNPIYPMCYRTYLNYLNIPTPPPKPTAIELTLFDFLDNHPVY